MLREDYVFILDTMLEFIARAEQQDVRVKEDCARFRVIISRQSFMTSFGDIPDQLAFLGLLLNQIFLRKQDLILSDLTTITNSLLTTIATSVQALLPASQNLQYIQGADPAAGAEVLMTVPAGVRWLVYTFTASLVDSATSGNRQVHLKVTDGANTVFTFPSLDSQKENETRTYFTIASGNDINPSMPDESKIYIPMPQLFLLPGYTLQTQTFNLKPTDNWGVPAIYVNVIQELA